MRSEKNRIGADRYIALIWANYAFELYRTQKDRQVLYDELKSVLNADISGKVTSRKTANHLFNLWLNKKDNCEELRCASLPLPCDEHPNLLPVLHLGLAINIFPIYKKTLGIIGLLDRVISPIPKQTIIDRVVEAYGNQSTIVRATARVLQTLEDWGFLEAKSGAITVLKKDLEEHHFSGWFISALLKSRNGNGIMISDLALMPEKLGIRLPNPREVIQSSQHLTLSRNPQGMEVITY